MQRTTGYQDLVPRASSSVGLCAAAAVGFLILLAAGCLQSPAVQCADGRLCPSDRVCDNIHGCVLPEQLAVCASQADGVSCSFAGDVNGTCLDGVCLPVGCGNGIVDPGSAEACDQGDANADISDAACRSDCQLRRCGDAVVDMAAGENCDDGNAITGDGCSSACIIEECGNGIIDVVVVDETDVPTEECDDGAAGLNHTGCAATCRQESPRWTGPVRVSPASGARPAMAYDAGRARVMMFAGVENGSTNETWEYDVAAQRWTELSIDAPPGRSNDAIAYDAARNRLVVFGGVTGNRIGETWELDGITWSRVAANSPVAPSPRNGHAMVYDSARGKFVLFGGMDSASGEESSETWEYDGAAQTWTEIAVSDPPSPRLNHAMAYDPTRAKTVLFGGDGADFSGETWEYDGAAQTWTEISVSNPPSPRLLSAMVYEARRGTMVLFGGFDSTGGLADTWEYNGAAWTQVATPVAPSARFGHNMAFDSIGLKVVLFGSFESADDDTWEYDGATQTWTQAIPANLDAPAPESTHAMSQDPARGKIVLFSRSGETWEYDGGSERWTEVAIGSPTAPSGREGAMLAQGERGNLIMFGGINGAGINNETWHYNGASQVWTLLPTANAPTPRHSHSMTYDGRRQKILLFGGQRDANRFDDSWEFDVVSQTWTQVAMASNAPAPQDRPAMAYDAARDVVVFFGTAAGVDGETWEYRGETQSWTQISTPNAPARRGAHAMNYDPARGKVLLFGGFNTSIDPEVWEFDGMTWTEIDFGSTASPTARFGHKMAYNALRNNTVLFGGSDANGVNNETWTLQYTAGITETCTSGFDGDGDGLVGCDDPDCWGYCTPHCPINSTSPWPSGCDSSLPRCGDGQCNPNLETPRLCPSDCGPPTAICGDFHCDDPENDPENAASCPGDCP